MKMKNLTGKLNGFSLLETLLAMVILSSGLLVLANSWSGSHLRIRKTKITTEIAALLERKITEIELEWKDKPLDSIPESKEEDFGKEYSQYSWKMESRELKLPDLSGMLTGKDGGANENLIMLIKALTEHLSKTVKEVKVTVFFKGNRRLKKPLAFSVTTYFVDYNKEIQVPGLMGGGTMGGDSGGGGSSGGAGK